jgi:predicted AAA+ superfamily ATPase
MQTSSPSELRADPVRWGHAVESAVGAQLMASVRRKDIDLMYWNVGCKEVDYVLRRDGEIAAIEVKSADADSVSGMHEFRRKYPQAKAFLIGGQGMSLETAFAVSAADLL